MFGILRIVAIVTAGLWTATAATAPATLAALQDGTTIVRIDVAQKKVVGSVALADGASLVGFDVRPADGRLYGVTPQGAIVTIDANDGRWTKVSQLSETLPAGVPVAVDFNPVADRLRLITADGTSLRVNVQDGKAIVDGRLHYGAADAGKGRTPRVTAAAYTNSVAGTKETTLYDIDAATGTLVRQVPPNDGTLVTVGSLGMALDGPVAFDIWSDGKGGNSAWLVVDGRLFSLNLSTGVAAPAGAIAGLKGRITDIAVLPAAAR